MTAEAQRHARAERRWWRTHRDHKELFDQELRYARRQLERGTKHELYGVFEGAAVRRLLLEKTGCHMYYVIDEQLELVRIVAIWGAARGRGPDLPR